MRYLKLAASWTLGTLILISVLPIGLPLMALHKGLELSADGSAYGASKVRKFQHFLGRRIFQPLFKVAQRIHPDGGDGFV